MVDEPSAIGGHTLAVIPRPSCMMAHFCARRRPAGSSSTVMRPVEAVHGGPTPDLQRPASTCPHDAQAHAGTNPAGAGTTDASSGRCARRGPTPPAGSHPDMDVSTDGGVGPNPQVRGAEKALQQITGAFGTNPAGAGSRHRLRSTGSSRRGQPRGCGEQSAYCTTLFHPAGPTPRVRGAEIHMTRIRRMHGTNPAGAGSRKGSTPMNRALRDQPRGCGEQSARRSARSPSSGPTPRVRGAAVLVQSALTGTGTNPAGAGSRGRELRFQEGGELFTHFQQFGHIDLVVEGGCGGAAESHYFA